ncbi:hypothetical protein KW782_03905 [Candidatus Parcubacteria bacterium]|nr:hypothetical protein [Candidatus Parcubacteria bacterium]
MKKRVILYFILAIIVTGILVSVYFPISGPILLTDSAVRQVISRDFNKNSTAIYACATEVTAIQNQVIRKIATVKYSCELSPYYEQQVIVYPFGIVKRLPDTKKTVER